jgi:hypothetical protein
MLLGIPLLCIFPSLLCGYSEGSTYGWMVNCLLTPGYKRI